MSRPVMGLFLLECMRGGRMEVTVTVAKEVSCHFSKLCCEQLNENTEGELVECQLL